MADTLFIFLKLYAVSALFGVPLFLLIFPEFLRSPVASLALVPYTGWVLLSIASVFPIHFNAPVDHSLWIGGFASLGIVVWKYDLLRSRFLSLSAAFRPSICKNPLGWAGAVLISLVFLVPILSQNYPSTPQFNGFDQAGYAQTALFLREGGTLKEAQQAIEAEVPSATPRESLDNNLQSIHFNAFVNSDFLNKMYRIGYPAVVSLATSVTGARHPYDVQYLTLFFPHIALAAFFCAFFSRIHGWAANLALCLAFAVSLNYNLLNVAFMGMHAQFFAMPLILAVFGCLMALRSELSPSSSSEVFPLFVFLLTAVFPLFPEFLFFLLPVAGALMFSDNLAARRLFLIPNWARVSTLALLFSSVLVFPQSLRWCSSTLGRIAYMKSSGFWQPVWALPAEIMGWWNVYSGPFYQLQTRSSPHLVITIAGSIFFALLILDAIRKRVATDSIRVVFALSLFVALILLKTRVMEGINNYQYTKSYAIALPMLVFAMGHILISWLGSLQRYGRLASLLLSCGLAATVIGGVSYLRDATSRSTWIGLPDYELLAPELNEKLRHMVLLQLGLGGSAYWYVPLLHFNWLNETPKKIVQPHLKNEVALLIPRQLLSDPVRLQLSKPGSIVFLNQRLAVIRTGVDLQSAFQLGRIDAIFDLSLLGSAR